MEEQQDCCKESTNTRGTKTWMETVVITEHTPRLMHETKTSSCLSQRGKPLPENLGNELESDSVSRAPFTSFDGDETNEGGRVGCADRKQKAHLTQLSL